MRYAVILAGGSGTRLWPMSRDDFPKQLLPLIGGKSLLETAYDRLEGLVPVSRRFVCALETHGDSIAKAIPALGSGNFIGEPEGKDTLNALALCCAMLREMDPDAVVAVFTADHLIGPESKFREIIRTGYEIAETAPKTLVTFGVRPAYAATGYGYLELGDAFVGHSRRVSRFIEKPSGDVAETYLTAGPQRYLWNSGMFAMKAATFMECVNRFQPEAGLSFERIASAWGSEGFESAVKREYPSLTRISVDYAVMQPASTSADFTVAAVPLDLSWLDVGSWPSYGETLTTDSEGNAGNTEKVFYSDSRDNLVVSDDAEHLIAVLGCSNLIVVRTGNATLICEKSRAEEIKRVRSDVERKFGKDYV